MKRKLIYTVALIAISLTTGLAQELCPKGVYTFERIETKSPWLASGNGAGLVFNKALNFSTVGAYYGGESGSYRNFNEAKTYDRFGIATKSYIRQKNLFLYGSFAYDYGIRQKLSWLGTIYPGETLNPIVDSIPGKVLREDYLLNAKIGYRISDRYSAGVSFDYHTATGAKRVDGRNSNTMSKFSVAPGVTFNSEYLTLGLNATYKHNVERVSYSFIGDVTGKDLYYFEGLWFFNKTGITNTTTKDRAYFTDIFGGGLQAELKLGSFKFYNQLAVDYRVEDDFEGGQLLKRYATVDGLKYDYRGIISHEGEKMDHYLNLSFVSDENFSYNVVTNYEEIPGEPNSWTYFEYGKTLRYMQTQKYYGAEYKGLVKRCDWRSSWEVILGFKYSEMDKDYKVYPAEYKQNYNTKEYYGGVKKGIEISKKNYLDISMGYGYTFGDGTMLESINPLSLSSLQLNENILKMDYAFNTADKFKVSFGARYCTVVNAQKGSSMYIDFKFTHIQVPNAPELDGTFYRPFASVNRGLVNLSFGFNF